ncbi:unnamed protein product [Orchesella dallaii]|uniref:RING-CH-type domain-containing protein n=1 Tax=Orchesella dallaii TaxID=48710 RepID=A0ABP1S4A7_9HEXA
MSNENVSKKPSIVHVTIEERPLNEEKNPTSENPPVPVLSQADQILSTVPSISSESHATEEREDKTNKTLVKEQSVPKGKQVASMHEMVLVSIEDCSMSGKTSSSEQIDKPPNNNQQPLIPNSNNCMALIPISATSQLVPVALLGKSSNSQDECPGGIMQLITGTNKVAPAASSDAAQTVGAVLMIIPKKSDTVCIDLVQDVENNRIVESPTCNCASNTAVAVPVVENVVPETDHAAVKPTQSYDSYEEACRICHDNPSKLELISPCLCKGSMSKVHRSCLERWLGESAKNTCEICGYEYNTVRKPKEEQKRKVTSMRANDPLSHPQRATGMRDASNATWTSVGLLSLTGTLLAAYYIWLFVAVRYHIQIWRDWQQRNFTVTIVPFADGCMGRPPPPRTTRDTTAESSRAADNLNYNNLNNANNNLPLIYSSGARGMVYGRAARFSGNHNMPAIFSRSHFLRNAHPGYTISETTLMYQAIYGSDSDNALLNDNLLAFIADSSEDMLHEHDTESSSEIIAESVLQSEIREIEQQCLSSNINQEASSKQVIRLGGSNGNIVEIPSGTHIEVINLNNTSVSRCQIQPQPEQQDVTNDNSAVVQESNKNYVTISIENDHSNDKGSL